jgi:hypothetical protein
MIRVIDQAGVVVQKNGLRFLESDAMLREVGVNLLDRAIGVVAPCVALQRAQSRGPGIDHGLSGAP